MTVFEVSWGAASHTGIVRDHNEDAWLAASRLFLVADGLGGHERGEVASRAVVDAFRRIADDWLTGEKLREALLQASTTVAALDREGRAPGSTVVGVGLTEQPGPPCWLVFNVGDSRAYLLRGGSLEQISVDHSRVQELLDAGRQLSGPISHNVITRAIGAGVPGPAAADQWLVPATVGDRILLCSDGLTTEVSDQLIAAALLTFTDPQLAADELVRSALTAGGRDNVTALVVDVIAVDDAGIHGIEDDTIEDLSQVCEQADPLEGPGADRS
mgnify:FL=1